jgi:hypothetical protein
VVGRGPDAQTMIRDKTNDCPAIKFYHLQSQKRYLEQSWNLRDPEVAQGGDVAPSVDEAVGLVDTGHAVDPS